VTGALYYPPASRTAQWFQGSHPGAKYGDVEKVVWHTTETSGWPGYDSGAKAPHLTALPDAAARRVRWRQHFPLNVNARALRNEPGGVQTNLDGAVQVELIGTSDRGGPGLYWPDAPEWALAELADFAAFMHTEHGVPLRAAPLWLPYPSSYGGSRVRMSGRTWDGFRGHCGHQHAPENTHGDPGDLDAQRIMFLAARSLEPAPRPVPSPPPIPAPEPVNRRKHGMITYKLPTTNDQWTFDGGGIDLADGQALLRPFTYDEWVPLRDADAVTVVTLPPTHWVWTRIPAAPPMPPGI
jgi:hypothetical protein